MTDNVPSSGDVPAVVRALMRLYPPDFRRRYGDAMLEFQRERFVGARAAGEPAIRVWWRAIADVTTTLFTEWAHELRPHPFNDQTRRAPLGFGDRMSIIGRDIVHTGRSLRRNLGFSAATVATLALGIGATTAIFSAVHSVLLAPLPFPKPDRLVIPESRLLTNDHTWSITYADFMDWRDNHVFASVAAYQGADMDLTGAGEPVRVSVAAVTPQFFDALGAAPAKGRVLRALDYDAASPRAIVISDRIWRTQFGAQADIVGTTVEMNGIKRPVVGILPPGARWPLDVDVWAPLRLTTEQDPDLRRRDNFVFGGIARLKDGASLEQTRTIMASARIESSRRRAVDSQGRDDIADSDHGVAARSDDAASVVDAARRRGLSATDRLRERGQPAARTRDGASAASSRCDSLWAPSRWRIVREAFLESGMLSLAGGVLGFAIARALVRVIVAAAPADVPRIGEAAIDLPALAFAFATRSASPFCSASFRRSTPPAATRKLQWSKAGREPAAGVADADATHARRRGTRALGNPARRRRIRHTEHHASPRRGPWLSMRATSLRRRFRCPEFAMTTKRRSLVSCTGCATDSRPLPA